VAPNPRIAQRSRLGKQPVIEAGEGQPTVRPPPPGKGQPAIRAREERIPAYDRPEVKGPGLPATISSVPPGRPTAAPALAAEKIAPQLAAWAKFPALPSPAGKREGWTVSGPRNRAQGPWGRKLESRAQPPVPKAAGPTAWKPVLHEDIRLPVRPGQHDSGGARLLAGRAQIRWQGARKRNN